MEWNRMKRFLAGTLGLLLTGTAWAGVPPIDSIHVDPPEVQAHTLVKMTFTAHIAADAQHIPVSVKLLRLQWSGNETPVSKMYDDGTHGDVTRKDGTYTCVLKLKEPVIGLLSFRIQVKYKGMRTPVTSQAIFVNVNGSS